MRKRLALCLTVAALAASCGSRGETVLVVTVTLAGALPSVSALDVTLTGASAGKSENRYTTGVPISFPTTFTARLPSRVSGEIAMDVSATDMMGNVVARGREGLAVTAGARLNVLVRLDCDGKPCAAPGTDGGVSPGPDAGDDDPRCGNGRIDVDETCDTAIAAGAPGACPPADCDDGIPCTTDKPMGAACRAACAHEEIRARTAGDKCCPAGASNADDADCSPTCGDGKLDEGEVCETGLAAGAPGACPAATPPACDDDDACTGDLLVAAGTCSAVCAHVPALKQSGSVMDGCCPAGAWHAVDADCPASCGDGHLDAPAETCDVGIAAGAPNACPRSCDDGEACTLDIRVGAACQVACTHTPITAFVAGDGCCPAGATRRTDPDCAQTCKNGVVEPGETCDPDAQGLGACPTTCPPSPSACLRNTLVGSATDCTARCSFERVESCSAKSDGCCGDGCASRDDPDCSPTCGDGVVQPLNGETCDVAIPAGAPGACPKSCGSPAACTRRMLVSAGTCQATCFTLPVTDFRAGDDCCPAGADATLDPDCAPRCGNGVVETPGETCDYAADTRACPMTCPAGDACTPVTREGTVGTCTSACVARPVTACVSGDGCCPTWCTIATDTDCPPVCGDGARSAGEACDRGITAGMPGACAPTCDDHDACTLDRTTGTAAACTRQCSHARVTACLGGDGCCPAGCTAAVDRDCAPTCGDGKLGAGETCDPREACPITCPDDGDPCTRERLTGDADRCNVACEHVPVTACSPAPDLCCPTGCTPKTDSDCLAWGPR
jgi:hypothetical protein